MRKSLLFSSIISFVLFGTSNLLAGYVTWNAASGLFPDQETPPWTLNDTSSPENPGLAGGILTLGNDTASEVMSYLQTGSLIQMPSQLVIETEVRYVSGSGVGAFADSRDPIGVGFTTAPNVGNILQIGNGRIFLTDGNTLLRGPTASIDTSVFHTYKIVVNGTAAGSTVEVFVDNAITPTLSGLSLNNAGFNGGVERVFFGEFSSIAFGTSEWKRFSHNASVVPEPSSLALLGMGALSLFGYEWRRKRKPVV